MSPLQYPVSGGRGGSFSAALLKLPASATVRKVSSWGCTCGVPFPSAAGGAGGVFLAVYWGRAPPCQGAGMEKNPQGIKTA